MAAWIEEANKKIAELQGLLEKSHYQLSIEDIQIDATSSMERMGAIRQELITLRAQLLRDKQTKECLALQKVIQESLVAMTMAKPLNAKNGGMLICPYSRHPLNEVSGIALSNGCIYHRMLISNAAEGRSHFPRALPGSSFELSLDDVALAQQSNRINNISGGALSGLVASFAVAGIAGVAQWATGVSLFALLQGVLIAAGLGVGVAAGATVGLFVLPFVVAIGLGAWLGARYHAKHHANTFEPVSSNLELVKSSTAHSVRQMLDGDELVADIKNEIVLHEGERLAEELDSSHDKSAESESTVESIEEAADEAENDASLKPVEEIKPEAEQKMVDRSTDEANPVDAVDPAQTLGLSASRH